MAEYNKKEIGERIKIIRKEKGMTLEEFANLFEPVANKSNVSRWEKGLAFPSNERIKKIAEIGNISVEYLLYGRTEVKLPSFDDYSNFKTTVDSIMRNRNISFEEVSKYSEIEIDRLRDLYNEMYLIFLENRVLPPSEDDIKKISSIVGTAIGEIVCYYTLCKEYKVTPMLKLEDYEFFDEDNSIREGLLGRLLNELKDLEILKNTVMLSNLFDSSKYAILDNQYLSEDERQKVINCLNEILDNRK